MITRIRQLLDSKELSPTQFADLIGVGRPVVSHILSERNKPSLDVVQRIIGAFPEISLPWLLSGTGSMFDENVTAAPISSTPSEKDSATTSSTEPVPLSQPSPAASTPPPVAAPALGPLASPVEAPIAAAAVPARPATGRTPDAVAAPAEAAVPVAQPFRAGRFVPAAKAAHTPAAATPTSPPAAPQSKPLPSVPPAKTAVAASPIAEVLAAGLPPASSPAETVLEHFLPEPGKAIRRIVIFYRDGSFADYQPEQ